MSVVLIVFPPGAAGNHLKNLITNNEGSKTSLYLSSSFNVHSSPGNNFKITEAYDENGKVKSCVLHGHFGEVMSHRDTIKNWQDCRYILISPDTSIDRLLLQTRWRKLGTSFRNLNLGEYFMGEQVFLYEPFMIRDCLGADFKDIMNISISELFTEDISPVLIRISTFLNLDLNIDECLHLHKIWCKKNL